MTVPELQPGKVLGGKYTLQSLLWRSPWAATYRATLAPGQEVVVKVLDTALGGQQAALDAILRAGAAVVGVPPQLALHVLEHGKDPESGALFIVSRLSANPPLSAMLEQGALPPAVVVAIMRGVAKALDAAHGTRLAHLALKPTNIFVGPAPGYEVQLGDFGANAIRSALPDELRQSFSAPWLAPEQIANDAAAGPGSDIFVAGLVAFHALTRGSFWRSCSGATPDLAAWRTEVIAPPARASQRAIELGAVLSPAFDAVFVRALSVPRDRFASAGELAQALADAAGAMPGNAAWGSAGALARGRDSDATLLAPPPTGALGYAATVPRGSEGLPMSPLGGPGSPYPQAPGPVGGQPQGMGGVDPNAPVAQAAPNAPVGAGFAAAGPTASIGPGSVAGVPKKGGKVWIFVVVALVLLLVGGVTSLVLYQRAKANALANGVPPIGSDTASTGAPLPSSTASAAASAEPSAEPAASAAPAGSAEAPTAADSPEAGAPAAAPATGAATAAEPAPPTTAAPPPTADNPRPPPTNTATGGGFVAPSDEPRPHNTNTGHTSPPPGNKKPCGKFLERCPDSG